MSYNSSCSKCTTVSNIKFQEKSKSAVFVNETRDTYVETQVDKCLISTGKCADGMLTKPSVGNIIIELKGTDVSHGAQQVLDTAAFCKKHGILFGKTAGLIVATSYPKTNTHTQKRQEEFARLYKGPLHVVTKNQSYVFDNVLSFRGPLKP